MMGRRDQGSASRRCAIAVGVGAALVIALLWAPGALAASTRGYVNSKGEWVALWPARDRILVAPVDQAPSSGALLRLAEVVPGFEQGRAADGLVEWQLLAGDTPEAAVLRLRAAGWVAREAVLFDIIDSPWRVGLDRGALVRLTGEAEAEVRAALAAQAGLVCRERLSEANRTWLCLADDAEAVLTGLERARALPGVRWAVPDFLVPITLFRVPDDPFVGEQWHLQQASGADISAFEAWDKTMGDAAVKVAVLDTGVDTQHVEFDPARVLSPYNCQTQASDAQPGSSSYDSHGTCCAGLITARADNGEGVSGVCPLCTLIPVKTLDATSTVTELANVLRGFEHVKNNGAWVVSNSWGIPADIVYLVDMQAFYDAVTDLARNGRNGKGAVVLFASGNGDASGAAVPIAAYDLANLPEVMAVGGTDETDTVVSYSNYGPNLSVVAPTMAIDLLGNPGLGITTTDTAGDQGCSRAGFHWIANPITGQDTATTWDEPDASGNYTKMFNGTSASCPIAAGVVALTFSANPDLTAVAARRIVEATADKVGGVMYDANGHNTRYGFGRVNAARAVAAAPYGVDTALGGPCAESVNCLAGECAGASSVGPGVCATPCTLPGDCAPNQVCEPFAGGRSYCIDACVNHSDCSNGMLCDAGHCKSAVCTTAAQCPAGYACAGSSGNGLCQPACTSDAQCTGGALCLPTLDGMICRVVTCSGNGDCPNDARCQNLMCSRTLACVRHADCGVDQLCVGQTCTEVFCDGAEDCPIGAACPADGALRRCAPACIDNTECTLPSVCVPATNGGACRTIACMHNGMCPAGLECLHGLCASLSDTPIKGSTCQTSRATSQLWLGLVLLVLRLRRGRGGA